MSKPLLSTAVSAFMSPHFSSSWEEDHFCCLMVHVMGSFTTTHNSVSTILIHRPVTSVTERTSKLFLVQNIQKVAVVSLVGGGLCFDELNHLDSSLVRMPKTRFSCWLSYRERFIKMLRYWKTCFKKNEFRSFGTEIKSH